MATTKPKPRPALAQVADGSREGLVALAASAMWGTGECASRGEIILCRGEDLARALGVEFLRPADDQPGFMMAQPFIEGIAALLLDKALRGPLAALPSSLGMSHLGGDGSAPLAIFCFEREDMLSRDKAAQAWGKRAILAIAALLEDEGVASTRLPMDFPLSTDDIPRLRAAGGAFAQSLALRSEVDEPEPGRPSARRI